VKTARDVFVSGLPPSGQPSGKVRSRRVAGLRASPVAARIARVHDEELVDRVPVRRFPGRSCRGRRTRAGPSDRPSRHRLRASVLVACWERHGPVGLVHLDCLLVIAAPVVAVSIGSRRRTFPLFHEPGPRSSRLFEGRQVLWAHLIARAFRGRPSNSSGGSTSTPRML